MTEDLDLALLFVIGFGLGFLFGYGLSPMCVLKDRASE